MVKVRCEKCNDEFEVHTKDKEYLYKRKRTGEVLCTPCMLNAYEKHARKWGQMLSRKEMEG